MAHNNIGETSQQQPIEHLQPSRAQNHQQQDSESDPVNGAQDRLAGIPSTSGREAHDSDRHPVSVAMTPLQRQGSARLSLRTQPPSGVRKVRGLQNVVKSAPIREPPGSRGSLREHQSGPAAASPAMVAINSLRAGVFPADRQVREKIAMAAQRVLAARGLQRRRSSEAARASQGAALAASVSAPSLSSAPAATFARPSNSLLDLTEISKHEPQAPASVFEPHTEGSREHPGMTTSSSMPHLPIALNMGSTGPQPISLATATTIARGEPLSMSPRTGMLAELPSATANFHRPALRPASLSGGNGTAPGYRPFVVTTGTPRFAPEPPSRPAWPATPSPLRTQPLGAEPSERISERFPPGTNAEALLTLADLSSSHGPESSTYG